MAEPASLVRTFRKQGELTRLECRVQPGHRVPHAFVGHLGQTWTCEHHVHPTSCDVCCEPPSPTTRVQNEYETFDWGGAVFDSEPETDAQLYATERQAARRVRRLAYNDALVAAATSNSPLLRQLINVRLLDLEHRGRPPGIPVDRIIALLASRECLTLVMFGKRWIVESLANNREITLAQVDEYYRDLPPGAMLEAELEAYKRKVQNREQLIAAARRNSPRLRRLFVKMQLRLESTMPELRLAQ